MGPEDSSNRKKDPKIPKISQNPKNQNDLENVSLKIGPCRSKKLRPFFSLFSMWNGPFLTLGSGTSIDQNENLKPHRNRNIPLISGKYGLRNSLSPLESGFLTRNSEKKGPNFLGRHGPNFKTYIFLNCFDFLDFVRFSEFLGLFISIWWVFRTHVGGRGGQPLQNNVKQDHQWWRYHSRLFDYQSPLIIE